ncbi:hypothetical protein COE21_21315 [Bacillus thuringiensis]|nr:hypothetical protein COE21_21315 [Bacillus thuringiensis]
MANLSKISKITKDQAILNASEDTKIKSPLSPKYIPSINALRPALYCFTQFPVVDYTIRILSIKCFQDKHFIFFDTYLHNNKSMHKRKDKSESKTFIIPKI